MHTCALQTYSKGKEGMKPQATSAFQTMHSFWGYKPCSIPLKRIVPHSKPFLRSTCFNQSIIFSSTKLLPARWVGPPSLGSGFCQRSVFAAISVGRSLHLALGREGNFPLKCFLSLSLSPCLRYTLWKSSTSKIYFCTGYILCFTWSGFLFF